MLRIKDRRKQKKRQKNVIILRKKRKREKKNVKFVFDNLNTFSQANQLFISHVTNSNNFSNNAHFNVVGFCQEFQTNKTKQNKKRKK